MRLTCPCCGTEFPIEAGLLEDDAKRMAAVLADMDPALARAAMAYLRLFKPAKTALRLTRATKLLKELAALAGAGSVCRDERAGVRRATTPAMWAAGIEQMLTQAERLTLPLSGHGYLREVVYGVADKADAADERARETRLREGERAPESPAAATGTRRLRVLEELSRIQGDFELQLIDAAEAERRRAKVRGG